MSLATCQVMLLLGFNECTIYNHLLTSLAEFTRALEIRFGPFSFENHQQALFKLQQSSTVADYQKDFERLCNRINGLPQNAILDFFISRLKAEIQNELAILQPTSISQAIGLAKLVDTKIQAVKSASYRPAFPKPLKFQPYKPPPPLLPTPPAKLSLPSPNPPPKPPSQSNFSPCRNGCPES